MSRTVTGQRRYAYLAAILLRTRELALETVTGVTFQIEVGFVSDETVVHPARVEFVAV